MARRCALAGTMTTSKQRQTRAFGIARVCPCGSARWVVIMNLAEDTVETSCSLSGHLNPPEPAQSGCFIGLDILLVIISCWRTMLQECHCMLFLTDDNDFRGDSQEITIDVSLSLQPCFVEAVFTVWFPSAQRATCCLAGSQGGHSARMMRVLGAVEMVLVS